MAEDLILCPLTNGIKAFRTWAMPNRNTFRVKPIQELLVRYLGGRRAEGWIDPFARNSDWAAICNDIDPRCTAQYHLDWREFLSLFSAGELAGVILDPPYSMRQIMTAYGGKIIGKMVPMTEVNDAVAPLVKTGGYIISFGWNSNGVGRKRGFQTEEVLVIAHGGHHNDTIVTVERKVRS